MFDGSEFSEFDIQEAGLGIERTSKPSDGVINNWKPLSIDRRNLDIQDPDGIGNDTFQIIHAGTIADIEALERTMKVLGQAKAGEIQRFIAYCSGSLFALWTVVALIVFINTGNSWLLITDVGPASLFGVIVHYYFKKDK